VDELWISTARGAAQRRPERPERAEPQVGAWRGCHGATVPSAC